MFITRFTTIGRLIGNRLAPITSSSQSFHTSLLHAQLERPVEIHPPDIPGSDVEKTYPNHIVKLVDDISQLTLVEVSELTELLQKKLNIQSPMAMMSAMASMPMANAAAADEVEEEQVVTKTSFSVKLMKFDPTRKVPLIKEIKALVPEMNLVQAKKFVESAPGNVKVDVSKDEAEEIKKTLEAAGATVEIE